MNWNSNNNNEKIQWMDSSLTKDFGEANKISKEDYIGKLATAMSTTTAMIEAKPRPNFPLGLKRFVWDSMTLPLLRKGPYNVLA